MTVKIVDATGVLRTITRMSIMDGSGVLRPLRTLKIKDGSGTLRTVATFIPPLSATVDNAYVYGTGNSVYPATVTTNTFTVSAVGGTAPFTYAYSVVWVTGGTLTATAPTSATSDLRLSSVPNGFTYEGVMRCTITDALGATATVDITGHFTNESFA